MRNWKTTLSGIASIIAGVAMYVNDPLKANEALGLVIIGFGLIFAKDSNVSGPSEKLVGGRPDDRK